MTAGSVSAPLIIPIDATNHKHKNHISTKTRLCLHSESRGAEVFISLDGSKPDSRSRKYTTPILLPPGRVCVRAMARTRDGRESSTVTKVFLVDDVIGPSPDLTNCSPHLISVTNDRAAPLTSTNQRPPQRSPNQSQRVPPQHCNTPWSETTTSCKSPGLSPKTKTRALLGPDLRPEDLSFLKTLSRTEKSRIQTQTDFLRSAITLLGPHGSQLAAARSRGCPDCLGPRPEDPAAIHCPLCGARVHPLPSTAPPTEASQMRSCVCCGSLAPVSSESCFICDAPLAVQLHPQSPLHLSPGVLCSGCGALNPGLCCSCVFCDRFLSNSAPCGPAQTLHGSQSAGVGHVTGPVTCHKCGASTPCSTLFCSTCGAPPTQSTTANQVGILSHTPSAKAPPTAERSTQTAGLYFPSATALRTKQDLRTRLRNREGLSTISPGRGFWRQQVDHVCAHLRSHAQNHTPFRTLLGEPRLGRLVSAAVREDPQEVTLLLSFSTAPPQDIQNLMENLQEQKQSRSDRGAPSGGSGAHTLSNVTEGLSSSSLVHLYPDVSGLQL